MNETDVTNETLMLKKEEWLDSLRYFIMKERTSNTREKRYKNNKIYKENQQRLFSGEKEMIGETPNIGEFVKFWGELWEESDETPYRKWMVEIEKRISNKIINVEEFKISEEKLKVIIKKRKNWSAPGIDGYKFLVEAIWGSQKSSSEYYEEEN